MRPGRWRGFRRVDRLTLRAAVLEGDALMPLALSHPAQAAQLLTDAVIERDARSRLGGWMGEESLEITDAPHWFAPLPERGPFLGFLNAAAEHALGSIVGIVDHATARWQSPNTGRDEHGDEAGFDVEIGGRVVQLVGDAQLMHWHRGDSRVPSVLASALMAVEAWLYRRLDAGEQIDDALAVLRKSRSLAIWGLLTEIAAYRPALLRSSLQPLITGADLLRADSLYRHQPHDYLVMPAISDRAWGERIHSWYAMPHRSTSVLDSVLRDVLAGEALVDELAAARERWRSTEPERLKYLIAKTDPANYYEVAVGNATGLAYRPPEALREEVEQSQTDLEATQFWLAFPYRLREWIDARRAFDDTELEQLWLEAQKRFANVSSETEAVTSIFAEGLRSQTDLECGLAAVLVVCARPWLEAHPDRAVWCRERLLAPFADPPPSHEFDFAGNISTERWDMFCADAIPVLWRDAPADRDLRAAIARLAVGIHRNTVARVFSTVASMPELAGELQRLETVALHWARFSAWRQEQHHRREYEEHGFASGPSAADLPDVETPTRAVLESFEAGTLPARMSRLAEWLADTPEAMAGARADARSRALVLVDPDYLLAAFAHLLTLDDDPAGEERHRRLVFAADLADYLASALIPDQGDREVDGTPYEFERTAFAYLARIAVAATPDESRPIWQPLLAAGAPAGYWVDDFLGELWRSALAADQPPLHFPALVKEMLAFASGAPTWQAGHHAADLNLAVVGLDRWTSGPVNERHAELIESLQPEWGDWVRARLRGAWSARRVVYFFGEPGADRIYEQALGWLADRERESAPTDDDFDQALAEMLLKLHGRHRNLFRGESAPASNARLLLSRLAGRGNALALEVTSQLG